MQQNSALKSAVWDQARHAAIVAAQEQRAEVAGLTQAEVCAWLEQAARDLRDGRIVVARFQVAQVDAWFQGSEVSHG